MRAGKSLLTLLSVLVFGITAFAWATVGGPNGLTTADVLDSGAGGEQPADGAIDVLLVGVDSRTDAQGHPLDPKLLAKLHAGANQGEIDTDTIMLVHIPNNGQQAVAVSIPRDSVVDRPGYGMNKINSAYLAAKNTALRRLRAQGVTDRAKLTVESNQAGAKELIKTVQQFTGVTIDHYAQVNLIGFYNISKAIGGVPVCLNHDVSDPRYSGAHFHKGYQELEGAQALAFVRQRHNIPGGSTDIQRERRQQAFLASMAHKVLSGGTLTNPAKLNRLMNAIQQAVVVDKGWNLMEFAQQMAGLTSGDIKFVTIPVVDIDAHSEKFGSYVKVDPQQVQAFIDRATQPPQTSKPSTPSAQADNRSNAGITVEVRNASGVPSLASHVSGALTSKGFGKGEIGNASHRAGSVVQYPQGGERDARKVAAALGGSPQLELDSDLPSGHVLVLLGTGYTGLGSNSYGSAATTTTAPPPTPPVKPIVQRGDGPPCVD